jgi:hypothetical protein
MKVDASFNKPKLGKKIHDFKFICDQAKDLWFLKRLFIDFSILIKVQLKVS